MKNELKNPKNFFIKYKKKCICYQEPKSDLQIVVEHPQANIWGCYTPEYFLPKYSNRVAAFFMSDDNNVYH